MDAVYRHHAWDGLWIYVVHEITSEPRPVTIYQNLLFTVDVMTYSFERQQMIYQEQEGLLKWVVTRSTDRLEHAPFSERFALMTLFATLLHMNIYNDGGLKNDPGYAVLDREQQNTLCTNFLQHGLMRAALTVAMAILSEPWHETSPGEYLGARQVSGAVLSSIFTMIVTHAPVGLPDELFLLSRNDTFRLATIIYKCLKEVDTFFDATGTISCAASLTEYLRKLRGPELLKLYLLHEQPRGKDAGALLEWMVSAVRLTRNAALQKRVASVLEDCREDCPAGAVLLDAAMAHYASLDRQAALEDAILRCAYPDCTATKEGPAAAKMVTCERCLKVHYCSKEHQQQHQSSHDATCQPSNADACKPCAVVSDEQTYA
jgi:hypothetical protein